MSTNPYAAFLRGQDPASLVRQFPDKLTAVISKLGTPGMGLSLAPGKWTVGQILCHLADCEIAFAFRWRQALAEDNHVVQPFDQDHWATHYASLPAEDALQTFSPCAAGILCSSQSSPPQTGIAKLPIPSEAGKPSALWSKRWPATT
jgi:hypothetical protein